MASAKNDALTGRAVEGSINHYQNQTVRCTAADRGLAERLGYGYNILSNSDRDEVYFRGQRPNGHTMDDQGRHTAALFGARRRKFPADEHGGPAACQDRVGETMRSPEPNSRDHVLAQRRTEFQVAQMENSRSYAGFQQRTQSWVPPAPRRLPGEDARKTLGKAEWELRRTEAMARSTSSPSLSFTSREAAEGQLRSSLSRVENHDFAVARKNNHYSSQDKLTRADPFYAQPRLNITSNSVKYDIVSNGRKAFAY